MVLQAGSEFIVEPLGQQIWNRPEQVSSLLGSGMSGRKALLTLGIIWTFAAFGEELGYRGYLLTRAADLGNRSTAAYVIAMIGVAVLFWHSTARYYKGPGGVLNSTYSGLVLGTLFLVSGRNLWAPILAHGISAIRTLSCSCTWAGQTMRLEAITSRSCATNTGFIRTASPTAAPSQAEGEHTAE